MPVARFEMPDGKIGRFEVPDGTTPEQANSLIQQHIAQSAQAPEKSASSLLKQYANDVWQGTKYAGPLGAAFGASKVGNELINKAAYYAGGAVTDFAANRGASPEVAAGMGYATNLAPQVALAFAGGGAAGKTAPLLESGAKSLMQSAIKPTLADLRSGDAAKAITTMLEEGFNPTKGGVEAMKAQIAQLGDQVTSAVKNSTAMINKNAVADRLKETLAKFSNQVNPGSDVKAIESAWTQFLEHPLLAGKPQMKVQTAQDLKQGTYASLGSKAYGEVKGADMEAQKALARGLKEEISAAVPGVAEANARQAALINAKEIAERRALMESNKNPMGLALLAHEPMAGLGFLADRSALVKSLMARMLYANSGTVPTGLGALTPQYPALMRSGMLYPQQ